MKIFRVLVIVGILFSLLGCVRAVMTANKRINNGFDTAYQEFKPSELLTKYEWFKDAYAQLGAKKADIEYIKMKMAIVADAYKGKSRTDWAKDDRETYNLWMQEYSGIILSYNDLAAQYNSQMSKLNWRFTNVGNLPQGEIEIMPRGVAPYKTDF